MRPFAHLPAALAATIGFIVCVAAAPQTLASMIHRGFEWTQLGGATLGLDPLGELVVSSIGGSGVDGVSIAIPAGATGVFAEWGDLPGGLNESAGTSSRYVLRAAGGFDISWLTVTRNADGSQDLTVDFSPAGPATQWLEVLEGDDVVGRVAATPGMVVHVQSASPLATKGLEGVQFAIKDEGVKVAQDDATSLRFEVRYVGRARISIADVDDADNACIRFQARQATFVQDVVALDVLGTDPDGPGFFAIKDPGVKVFDAEAEILGQSRFDVLGGDAVSVSSFGASGEDGVALSRPGHPTFTEITLDLAAIGGDTDPPAPDAGFALRAFGTLNGTPDQAVGTLSVGLDGGGYSVHPDFGDLGVSTYVVRVRDGAGGEFQQPGQTAAIGMPPGRYAYRARLDAASGGVEFLILCITDPCPTFVIGGLPHTGVELSLRPEAPFPLGVGDCDRMCCVGKHIATITIERIKFDNGASPLAVPRTPVGSHAIELSAAYPNPTVGRVAVLVTLARPERVRAEVLDATGRIVRRLHTAELAAGTHALAWDGRRGDGRDAEAGVYFVQVRAGMMARTARLTLLP